MCKHTYTQAGEKERGGYIQKNELKKRHVYMYSIHVHTHMHTKLTTHSNLELMIFSVSLLGA